MGPPFPSRFQGHKLFAARAVSGYTLLAHLPRGVSVQGELRALRSGFAARAELQGDVVQLVRTLPCHGRGRGFESRRPRHFLSRSGAADFFAAAM